MWKIIVCYLWLDKWCFFTRQNLSFSVLIGWHFLAQKSCSIMESDFANNFSTHQKERFKTISLIKQPRKILNKPFVASLTWNKRYGGIFSKKKAINGKKFFVCLLSVSIKYSVSLHSSLHSYNKQIILWLVRLYDFHNSLAAKDRSTHSFAVLTRSSNNPSQLANKNRTHSPTMN